MRRTFLVFIVLLAAVVSVQLMSHAYGAELSTPDEPGHYITGLMIRDYVLGGVPASPMTFGTAFYLHYPKVAFGHWPPGFHLIGAVWMMVAPATPGGMLALVAVLVAALATLVFRVARREWSTAESLAIALLFIALPTTQYSETRVLADAPIALVEFIAALCWARFLVRERTADSVAFGLVAGFAMSMKGNGAALLLLPPLATVLAGRWRVLLTRRCWAGIALMALLGVPWQFYTWTSYQTATRLSVVFWPHVVAYATFLRQETGIVILLFAAVGAAAVLSARDRDRALWATVAGLAAAVFLFHVVAPIIPASRFLVPMMPSMLLLAAAGVHAAAGAVPATDPRVRRAAAALLGLVAVATFAVGAFAMARRGHYGYREVAEALVAQPCENCAILTSSQGEGDGMLIAEIAARETNPTRFVLRADKVLSRSTWDGDNYELFFSTPDEVNRYLLSVPVDFVVLDETSTTRTLAHHQLLADVMAWRTDDWKLVRVFQAGDGGSQRIAVYQSTHPQNPRKRISVDMTYSLGRPLRTDK